MSLALRRWIIVLVCSSPLCSAFAQSVDAKIPTPRSEQLAQEVTRIADTYIAQYSRMFPELAELNGLSLPSHAGLSDNSLRGLHKWQSLEDGWAKQLESIPEGALGARSEWVTLGFVREAVQAGRALRVCRNELWPANQIGGWQAAFLQLLDIQPVGSDKARAEAFSRWSKLPQYLDNEIANLREGARTGYTSPRRNVELVIEQLNALLSKPLDQSPYNGVALRDGTPSFAKKWATLLNEKLRPAIERYRSYLRDDYVKHAREAVAITANKNGAACYDASFRYFTTISRSASETFELGQREVEKNRQEALQIGRAAFHVKDLAELNRRITQDRPNHFASREDKLAFARDAVARARGRLGQWFSRVPQARVEVEPYAEMLEKSASDSYWPGAQDGSHGATYRITLFHFLDATRSTAEINAFHEAYPGHHLQGALAQEAPATHPIAWVVLNAGFSEGWARYAEALAEDMGLYASQYARANRRMWPARGMVVDPGVHLFGWTREQAIAFMLESGHFSPEEAEALFDRIAVWPAQLTAYDTGALEFFALRQQAREQLGARFDIKEFHDVILSSGTLTLPMLRQKVERWLATK